MQLTLPVALIATFGLAGLSYQFTNDGEDDFRSGRLRTGGAEGLRRQRRGLPVGRHDHDSAHEQLGERRQSPDRRLPGGVVAVGWQRLRDHVWDRATTTQITSNSSTDIRPDVSDTNIVWQRDDGNDFEIDFWDGNAITAITDNVLDDLDPAISGTKVAWEQDTGSGGGIRP